MIRVYVITEVSKERSRAIANLFIDGRFEVMIPNFELLPTDTEGLETKKVLNVLLNSKSEAPDKPVMLIKDSSTTTCMPEQIAKFLNQIVVQETFDLFYLCRWLDLCETNKKESTLGDNNMINVSSSNHAQGFQAILFSQTGRDKVIDILSIDDSLELSDILYKKLASKQLDALVSNPNIFEFDINLNPKDGYKMMTCAVSAKTTRAVPKATSLTVETENNTWVVIIGILVLILIIIIFRY
jgi:hypothetical protein